MINIIDLVWFARNIMIHEDKELTNQDITQMICNSVNQFKKHKIRISISMNTTCIIKIAQQSDINTIRDRWLPPPNDFYKANCNANLEQEGYWGSGDDRA